LLNFILLITNFVKNDIQQKLQITGCFVMKTSIILPFIFLKKNLNWDVIFCETHVLAWYNQHGLGSKPRLAGSFESGYSGVCFEIKFSGRHREFDGVLFTLWPLV